MQDQLFIIEFFSMVAAMFILTSWAARKITHPAERLALIEEQGMIRSVEDAWYHSQNARQNLRAGRTISAGEHVRLRKKSMMAARSFKKELNKQKRKIAANKKSYLYKFAQ